MVQRIQTLWLLLAAACMALTLQVKFAAGMKTENNLSNQVLKNVTSSSHIISLVLALVFLAITVYTILIFKKRKAQMGFAVLNIVVGIAATYFLYWQTNSLTDTTIALGAALPIFATGFTISALHCIYQDEKKIKDLNSNRLR